MNEQQATIYEQVGGSETFRRLVDAFYRRVEQDDTLRAIFPADLEPGKRHQLFFLIQYFGGPQTYSSERGHPRLRMRHAPFPIGPAERDAWLAHMLAAIDEVGITEPARSAMRAYFQMAAPAMMNQEPPIKLASNT
ncbi:MAG: globin [Oscillochloridaceae bacterium umkhey_bin13]